MVNTANFRKLPPATPKSTLDLAFQVLEPHLIMGTKIQIIPMRVRADRSVVSATFNVSQDDVTYDFIRRYHHVAGGSLASDMPADSFCNMATSIPLEALGTDLAPEVTSLSEEEWRSGKQWMVIDDEIFFVKSFTALGGDLYQPTNVLRARLGTDQAAHAAGATAYVGSFRKFLPISDPILFVDRTWYAKTQLAGGSESFTIDGKGITPAPVKNLSTRDNTNVYETGDDIEFSWSFYRADSLSGRTGAGNIPLGTAYAVPYIDGEFIIKILVGAAVKNTYTQFVNNYWTYSATNRTNDGVEGSTFFIDVYHQSRGKLSLVNRKTITHVP